MQAMAQICQVAWAGAWWDSFDSIMAKMAATASPAVW